jgi:hypothetical protein
MRSTILAAVVLGLTAVGGVDEARAQFSFGNSHFGISIGTPGYGYGGMGYGGYGGYRPYGYGPYVGPGYGTGVNIVVPSYSGGGGGTYVRQATPPAVPPQRPGAGLPIKLMSPDDAGVAIKYSINEYGYTIEPGHSQTITNDRDWVITFDRGGDFGIAQYTLSPGIYTFALTDKGWQVYHDADMSKLASSPAKTVAKNELPEPK